MSDTESEQECNEEVNNIMIFIAEKVHGHPEILEKSQIPSIKNKKTAALNKIIIEYSNLFGKEIDSKTLLKKINNMKTRLKNKTDKNKTGNKRIRLLPWEKMMLEAMNADINPVLSQIPGAIAVGVSTMQPSPHTPTEKIMTETASEMEPNKKGSSEPQIQEVVPKRKIPPKPAVDARSEETEETKYLSNSQLQRLVLIEQLKTTRVQYQYFAAKLQKQSETSSNMYTLTGDKVYYNM